VQCLYFVCPQLTDVEPLAISLSRVQVPPGAVKALEDFLHPFSAARYRVRRDTHSYGSDLLVEQQGKHDLLHADTSSAFWGSVSHLEVGKNTRQR
jgi:hypothetical protein